MPWYHECFNDYMKLVKDHVEIILARENYFDYEIVEKGVPLSFIQDFMRYAITTDFQIWWDHIKEDDEDMSIEESAIQYSELWAEGHIVEYYTPEFAQELAELRT